MLRIATLLSAFDPGITKIVIHINKILLKTDILTEKYIFSYYFITRR